MNYEEDVMYAEALMEADEYYNDGYKYLTPEIVRRKLERERIREEYAEKRREMKAYKRGIEQGGW